MSRRRKRRNDSSGYIPRKVVGRTPAQVSFIRMINSNDITLCHGPAGTGKTHIAAGLSVKMKLSGLINRIIICRPVVGVGKDIGYLPGTTEDKVGPYLVPLFDELGYYLDSKKIKEWLAEGVLEIVPLSMMRGRTFNNCFVILDEAQNAVMSELRMLLTRLGQGTKMVLSGDLNQSDLSSEKRGAFKNAIDSLQGIEGIGVCELTAADIVRHNLISKIEKRLV